MPPPPQTSHPPPSSASSSSQHGHAYYPRPAGYYPFPSTGTLPPTSSSYPPVLPPTTSAGSRHPSLSSTRRSFSQPLFSRLKNLQSPASSSSASTLTPPPSSSSAHSSSSGPGSSYTAVKMSPPMVLNDPPVSERRSRERGRDRSMEREQREPDRGDNMSSKVISSVRRHFNALRRAPTPVHEDYESALTAMRYGHVETAAPPPTIEQIARGLASRSHRPKQRLPTPPRSSLKRPSTAASLTLSSPTSSLPLTPSSSSSSFLPSFSPSLRRLSRSSSATGTTHTTVTTDYAASVRGNGGSAEALARKAVRFGERVMVVGRDGRRSSKNSTC